MYKIYINESVLILGNEEESLVYKNQPHWLVSGFYSEPKGFIKYIDHLEKSQEFEGIFLFGWEIEKLWERFKSVVHPVHAAGGCVLNESQEILSIYRRNSWDLPKGKLETGESKKACAIREVEEETGITGITVEEKIGKTYHVFRDRKQRRVLKISHWFLMYAKQQALTPQTEEDIELAEWTPLDRFLEMRPIYPNILDIAILTKIHLENKDG